MKLEDWVPRRKRKSEKDSWEWRKTAAHALLHIGEILLAITLADFFLRTVPKVIQAFLAGC